MSITIDGQKGTVGLTGAPTDNGEVGYNGSVVQVYEGSAKGLVPTGAASFPAGIIMAFTSSTPPTGWLACDGTNKSRTDFAALFTAISTNYGVGDGSTTFGLPDLKGRHPVYKEASGSLLTTGGCGVDGGTINSAGGAQSVSLVAASYPSHNHSYNIPASGSGWDGNQTGTLWQSGATSGTLGNTGSSTAHNNMPPGIVVLWCIKT